MKFDQFIAYLKANGWEYSIPIGSADPRDARRAIFRKVDGPPDEPIIVPIRDREVPDEIVDRLKRLVELNE